jgi:hypothetical protein
MVMNHNVRVKAVETSSVGTLVNPHAVGRRTESSMRARNIHRGAAEQIAISNAIIASDMAKVVQSNCHPGASTLIELGVADADLE